MSAASRARRAAAAAASRVTGRWLAFVLVAALAVGLGVALVGLPREHAPLPAIARRALTVALPRWHITEPVNEVVYGTRGFDTFGETFLLLAAVVSVVAADTPPRAEGRARGARRPPGAREEREIDPEHSVADRWEHLARLAEREEEDGGRRPAR